mgnify:CR=1 FL=1
MTTADIKIIDNMAPEQEAAILRSLEQRKQLQEEARIRAEADAAAAALEKAFNNLSCAQKNRMLLEEDIGRYESHVAFVGKAGPDNTALWLLTAAAAAKVDVARIEQRLIERRSPVEGVATEVTAKKVVITHAKGSVTLPVYGGRVLVGIGEAVHPNSRVVMAEGATHALCKGPKIDPLVVGFTTRDEKGAVAAVLVEGKGKQGYFTLVAHGLKPRFRFGRMVRGFDRLERLVGASLTMSAPIPVADLRAAADAAYGPCPQL